MLLILDNGVLRSDRPYAILGDIGRKEPDRWDLALASPKRVPTLGPHRPPFDASGSETRGRT